MRHRSTAFAYSLLLPFLLIMAALIIYPSILTFVNSFQNLNLLDPLNTGFVGLANYLAVLQNPEAQKSAANTLLYLVIATVGEIGGGLLFALVLKDMFRGRGIVLAIALLPWALPPVVNGAIWGWIYNPNYGVLNGLLRGLHITSTNHVWMGEPQFSLFLVALVQVWKTMPLVMIIILAYLQSVPESLYEAGRIDGAGVVQLFRYLTLPMIAPAIVIALSQTTIAAINLFDEAYVLTGTSLDTRSILVETYLITFRDLDLGQGMSLSFLITLVTIFISAGYVLWLYREVRQG